MSLIKPAPVAVPFSTWTTVPQTTALTIFGPHAKTPAISVIAGIDVSSETFTEGDSFQVSITEAIVAASPAIIFQGFVYANSQAYFAWRGELPIFDAEELQFRSFLGQWDVTIWGAYIPNISFSP